MDELSRQQYEDAFSYPGVWCNLYPICFKIFKLHGCFFREYIYLTRKIANLNNSNVPELLDAVYSISRSMVRFTKKLPVSLQYTKRMVIDLYFKIKFMWCKVAPYIGAEEYSWKDMKDFYLLISKYLEVEAKTIYYLQKQKKPYRIFSKNAQSRVMTILRMVLLSTKQTRENNLRTVKCMFILSNIHYNGMYREGSFLDNLISKLFIEMGINNFLESIIEVNTHDNCNNILNNKSERDLFKYLCASPMHNVLYDLDADKGSTSNGGDVCINDDKCLDSSLSNVKENEAGKSKFSGVSCEICVPKEKAFEALRVFLSTLQIPDITIKNVIEKPITKTNDNIKQGMPLNNVSNTKFANDTVENPNILSRISEMINILNPEYHFIINASDEPLETSTNIDAPVKNTVIFDNNVSNSKIPTPSNTLIENVNNTMAEKADLMVNERANYESSNNREMVLNKVENGSNTDITMPENGNSVVDKKTSFEMELENIQNNKNNKSSTKEVVRLDKPKFIILQNFLLKNKNTLSNSSYNLDQCETMNASDEIKDLVAHKSNTTFNLRQGEILNMSGKSVSSDESSENVVNNDVNLYSAVTNQFLNQSSDSHQLEMYEMGDQISRKSNLIGMDISRANIENASCSINNENKVICTTTNALDGTKERINIEEYINHNLQYFIKHVENPPISLTVTNEVKEADINVNFKNDEAPVVNDLQHHAGLYKNKLSTEGYSGKANNLGHISLPKVVLKDILRSNPSEVQQSENLNSMFTKSNSNIAPNPAILNCYVKLERLPVDVIYKKSILLNKNKPLSGTSNKSTNVKSKIKRRRARKHKPKDKLDWVKRYLVKIPSSELKYKNKQM